MSRREREGEAGWPGLRLWRHELPGGWEVLAGRTEADNEHLSTRLLRQNDYWFHVRGMPGSHVVLCSQEGEQPSRQTLEQAAAIAAWYSKGRAGGLVAVSCTLGKFVGKPRGAPVGTVEIRREQVLKVRPALPEGQDGEA
jgi:predicted ribosome quality control (RQC) complex YloA/Tae2 family protein